MTQEIKYFPISHGGIKRVHHARLNTGIDAQTAVITLRFYRKVKVDRLELPPIVYGRSRPLVPTHPAHLSITVFDRNQLRWETVRTVDLPRNPKFSGQGLSLETSMDKMERFFEKALQEAPPHQIELGGLETDHLRIECDREHPVWPNFGECNGDLYHVPFGIFKPIKIFGNPLGKEPQVAPYNRGLTMGRYEPKPLSGMELEARPEMFLFRSRQLAVGFSRYRPILLHLGWDELGKGKADINRLLVTRSFSNSSVRILPLAGLSGPVLRTLDFDVASHLWTGRLEVEGNRVQYLDLSVSKGLRLDAVFTVEPDCLFLELRQNCTTKFHAVEYEAWRLAFDVQTSPTGACGTPSTHLGRNGYLPLPAYLAGEAAGCLAVSKKPDADSKSDLHLQVESYRESEALTLGIVPNRRNEDGFGFIVPEGREDVSLQFSVTNLEPNRRNEMRKPFSEGIRRHWSTLFSCYRPEYRGFSNNCVSVNCHLGQWSELEVLEHTKQPDNGPNLLKMLRFTVEKAILDGGGYGYWREYFMDSDPSLLCAAGTAYRMDPSREWLERIRPGLIEIFRRMASQANKNGLLVKESLSGNSGEFTRSTNGIDTVCFGYLDAYSNAWAYRAFRNAVPLFDQLGVTDLKQEAISIAAKMRASYGSVFVNPETGWVAGWRSRDGALHDYAYLCINGMAIAFGLLDDQVAEKALRGLENLRKEVCPISPQLGLPINLIPHSPEDHYWPQYVQGSQPTYEMFTDGAVSSNLLEYYLRALSIYGFKKEARYLADEFDKGYAAGVFSGGVGTGNEMRAWDGIPTGYEGTLTYNHGLIYAVAVEKGFIQPKDPEWWPE